MPIFLRLLLLTAILLAVACTPTGSPTSTDAQTTTPTPTPLPRTLTVFAASSLQTALDQAIPLFQQTNLGVTVTPSYGGSPTLRSQLENGARAGLFLSADTQQVDLARKSGVVQGESAIYAVRALVVITPQDRPAVVTLKDLVKSDVRLVLAQKDVPVGSYARQALDKMSASPDFGSDFSARVLSNLVSEESNVGQAIAKVSLGEADAAIVYNLSDAEIRTDKVAVIPIPT